MTLAYNKCCKNAQIALAEYLGTTQGCEDIKNGLIMQDWRTCHMTFSQEGPEKKPFINTIKNAQIQVAGPL